MAGSRTLKLSILADVDDLNKKLKAANGDVEESAGKLEKFGKMASAAFAAAAAAAAAYAVKIGIDGVKAALEDEQAQVRLANALKNATGATEDSIASAEEYISKMQLAAGVSDTDLRSALSRLALSTNDLTKAQDLLSLALDISKARSIPLEQVANALGKAYDGNNTALTRLGLGLSSAELKTMSFTETQNKLSDLFGGAAAANAETYQGRIDRLRQAFDESVEAIGQRLLPIIEALVTIIVDKIAPNLSKFAALFEPIINAIKRNKDSFEEFGRIVVEYIIPILGVALIGAIKLATNGLGILINIAGTIVTAFNKVVSVIESVIGKLQSLWNFLKNNPLSKALGGLFSNAGFGSGFANADYAPSATTSAASFMAAGTTEPNYNIFGLNKNLDPMEYSRQLGLLLSSGAITPGVGYNSAIQVLTPEQAAAIVSKASPTVINNSITVNGAIDSEGAARQIVDLLNQSSYRGSLGSSALV